MTSLLLDLRVASRTLLARPGFLAVAVSTLALGVGATSAIFSVVHAVLLRPLPFEHPERIVAVWQTPRDNPAPTVGGSVSHVNFLDWQRQTRSFDALAVYSGATMTVTSGGESDVVPGGVVTPGFFKVFGAEPFIGRSFTAEEDRPGGPQAIVVSYGYWKERLGGRTDVLEGSVEISGIPRPVVGVAPAGFEFPRGARLWLAVRNDDTACGRDCVYLEGVGRLAPGITLAAARDEMETLGRRLQTDYPAANTNTAIAVSTLLDQIVGDVRLPLLVLLAAVAMVLLIACANVANLLLVRGLARQGEMAVRAALGAGHGRLVSFLLVENLLLACAGALAGLLLAWWGIGLLATVAPQEIPRIADVSLNRTTYLFALLVGFATAAVFGLAPVAQALRVPLASSLGVRGDAGSFQTRWTRGALVAGEVGLSLMLLFGAGLFLRSLAQLQTVDPGFQWNDAAIFSLSMPPARYPSAADVVRTFDQIEDQVASVTGVEAVGRINGLPLGPSENVLNFTRTDRPAPPPGQQPAVLYRVIDDGYFHVLGIPLLKGRTFTSTDRAGSQPVAIVSREMAEQFWPAEDPIGRQIDLGSTRRTIVGVVAGVRSRALTNPPQPELYVPHAQTSTRAATFVVRSSLPPGRILDAARSLVRRTDPKLPLIRPGPYADVVDRAFARPRFYLVLLSLFAVLAVTLAGVGVYGIVAYAVSQRTREIGVRVALGACRRDVIRLVLSQGLRPAAAGIVLGLTGAFATQRLIAGLLFDVSPADPRTLGAAVAGIAVLVTLACLIPARRATRIPPATALRME